MSPPRHMLSNRTRGRVLDLLEKRPTATQARPAVLRRFELRRPIRTPLAVLSLALPVALGLAPVVPSANETIGGRCGRAPTAGQVNYVIQSIGEWYGADAAQQFSSAINSTASLVLVPRAVDGTSDSDTIAIDIGRLDSLMVATVALHELEHHQRGVATGLPDASDPLTFSIWLPIIGWVNPCGAYEHALMGAVHLQQMGEAMCAGGGSAAGWASTPCETTSSMAGSMRGSGAARTPCSPALVRP